MPLRRFASLGLSYVYVTTRTHSCAFAGPLSLAFLRSISLLSASASQLCVFASRINRLRSRHPHYVTLVEKLLSIIEHHPSYRTDPILISYSFRLVIISIWLNEGLTIGGKRCPIHHMLSAVTGKKQFRRRAASISEYQVDEDVWARHPSDGFMYIASITTVHRSRHTCIVTFVGDGAKFTLPINHLRHVTLADIQLNRCVDYGTGWTEHTQFGTMIKYDRYGEKQYLQYCEPFSNSFGYIETSASYNINAQETPFSPSSLNREVSTFDCTQSSAHEPIWVRIPHPEDPAATYSHCPIWNAVSYADAEKQALELCKDDIHYREALHIAERQLAPCEPLIPPHLFLEGSIGPKLPEHTIPIDGKSIKSGPARSDSFSSTTELLPISDGPQLSLTNISEHSFTPPILIPTSTRLSAVPENDVATESFSSFATTEITTLHQQGLCIPPDQSKQLHRPSPFISTEVTDSHPQKHNPSAPTQSSSAVVPIIDQNPMYRSDSRFYRSYFYCFPTDFTLILLVLLLIYQLLIGSPLPSKEIPHVSTATTRTINIGATGALTTAIFICGLSPLSLMSNGPSKSLFEQWPYPFTTPW